jgi:hypothetical protein
MQLAPAGVGSLCVAVSAPDVSHWRFDQGGFPSLEGGEAMTRHMRFATMDEVEAQTPELRRVVKA